MPSRIVFNCSYPFSHFISPNIFLVIGLFVLVFLVLWSFYSFKSLPAAVLIFMGGSFTLYERLLNNNCVRDYLSFFGLFKFNLYDLMVTAGISILLLKVVKDANKV